MTTALVRVIVIAIIATSLTKRNTVDVNMATNEGRQSQMTEKGRAYAAEVKQKDLRRLLLKLHKDENEFRKIDHLHLTTEEAESLLVKIRDWKHDHLTCLQVQEDLKSLLSGKELEVHNRLNEEVLTESSVFRAQMDVLEGNMLTYLRNGADSNTQADGNVEDGRSAVSVRSTTSSVRARLLEKKIDDERQKAKAAVELAAFKRRRELERRQQELQWEMTELELQTQMDTSMVQSEVAARHEATLASIEENQNGSGIGNRVNTVQCSEYAHDVQVRAEEERRALNITSDARQAPGPPHQEPELTRLEPADRETKSAECAVTDVLRNLSQLMTEQALKSQLPVLEPEIFTGEIEKYAAWLTSFECYIEARTQSPIERLHYLTAYTGGEAHRAIQGLLMLRSDDAYEQAKQKLQDRYGNDFLTVNTYKQRLRGWPAIRTGDGKALRDLADFLEGCQAAAQMNSGLQSLGDPHEVNQLLKRLPKYLVDRWKRIVDQHIYEPRPGEKSEYPSFSQLVSFISKEARVESGPVEMQMDRPNQPDDRPWRRSAARNRASTFVSSTAPHSGWRNRTRNESSTQERSANECMLCAERHLTQNCPQFMEMTPEERQETVREMRLCRGCLNSGHFWRECRKKATCSKCARQHPTLLHVNVLNNRQENQEIKEQKMMNNAETQTATSLQSRAASVPCSHSMVVPVRLHHSQQPDNQLITYAVLDPQSDACFAKASVLESMGVVGEETNLELSTMAGKARMKTSVVNGLTIESLETGSKIELPRIFARDDIPIDRKLIPRKNTVQSWRHLTDVASDLPDYYQDADIGLLIGLNCGRALKPKKIVTGADTEPWAVLTELGWSVVGMINNGTQKQAGCCVVSTGNDAPTVCHYAFRTRVKEITPTEVSRLFDLDFKEFGGDTKTSQEDKRFMQMMEDQMTQREDGHFVAPLPLKDPDFTFQNNRSVAVQRLNSLKRRMLTDPQFRDDYQSFMADMIEKGYAEEIPDDELSGQEGKMWYVAHHGVYSQKKEKIRVVFDCSGSFKGQCLNSQLMQGPDVSNNMAGILMRFRKGTVAITCDIQGMFNQVMVAPEDRDLLRFVWWRDGDIRQEPVDFRMATHLFGATSSPSCAMSALNKTADIYENEFGAEAADFIRRDFYVDDGLTSTADPAEAIQLAKNTIKMCEKGGFQLHKFTSNCSEVMAEIPANRRAKSLENVDIRDHCIIEQALGIKWNLQDDCFLIDTNLQEKPMTRRGILSMVSSVYDPLGWIAPFTLIGKNILKLLCCDERQWDDPLPEDIQCKWIRWKSELEVIGQLSVRRCYAPPDFNPKQCEWELHHFSDASFDGYGECSYLRILNGDGRVSTALVMSKNRVTPKRPMTIPRLELAAALTAVKASEFLRKELCVPKLQEYFWTDSKAVLGYIKNESKRFHVFVANRVQQIRQSTSVEQWRYISSAENPADLTSRGCSADNLAWLVHCGGMGAVFLRSPGCLPEEEEDDEVEISPEDPEVKATSFQSASSDTIEACQASLIERLSYFSSWIRAKNAVALCLRYKQRLVQRVRAPAAQEPAKERSEDVEFEPVTAEEKMGAERIIIKAAQCQLKEDTLKRLNPFVGDDELLRVGGRLKRSSLPAEVVHPVILPKESHVSKLIIGHAHEKLHHPGRETTLSEIRHMGYWILRGRSAVSKHVLNCVKCRRLRGTPQGQKMADLPQERVQETDTLHSLRCRRIRTLLRA